MLAHFPLRLASLALACVVLTGCSASKPQCQKDPPFYLRERCALLAEQLAEPHERYRLVPADLARLQAALRNAIIDIDRAFAEALVEPYTPRVRSVRHARLHLVTSNNEGMIL